MGFPTPIRQWLLSREAQPLFTALLDADGFVAPYVSMTELRPLIERHLSNQEDATDRLWRLLGGEVEHVLSLQRRVAGELQAHRCLTDRRLPCDEVYPPAHEARSDPVCEE